MLCQYYVNNFLIFHLMPELQSLSKGGCLIDFLSNYQYNVINWKLKSEAGLEIKDIYSRIREILQ